MASSEIATFLADRKVFSSSNVVEGLTRVGLYELFAKVGFTIGAEIGVWYGVNAKHMLDKIPNLRLYLVDPYKEYVSGRSHYKQEYLDLAYARARRRLRGQNVKFFRMSSLLASRKIADGLLDFVYVDGNHTYAASMLDMLLWVPKVRKGGVISGHDYINRLTRGVGVKSAVDDYTRFHKIDFRLTDRYAEDHGPNAVPSWFWIK